MPYSQEKIEEFTHPVICLLGDQLSWRWEDRFSVMLSEFSRNKKDKTLLALRQEFQHEWNKKTIKKAPKVVEAVIRMPIQGKVALGLGIFAASVHGYFKYFSGY